MVKKCLFLFLVLAIIFGISACGSAGITFPDRNLDAAIRNAINKPEGPIHTSDLEELTSLRASDRDITSLKGLEHCTNLTRLELDFNQIRDISPLASLTNLTILGLWSNQISDISPLVSLSNLSSLYIGDNPLNTESVDTYIPQLKKRGVNVEFTPDGKPVGTGGTGVQTVTLIAIAIFAALVIIPIILWKREIVVLSGWLIAFWVVGAIFCLVLAGFLTGLFAEDETMILTIAMIGPLIFVSIALFVFGILAFVVFNK